MKNLTIPADVCRLNEIISTVEDELQGAECSTKTQMQIALAIEEVFVNIASYAYNGSGDVNVLCWLDNEPATILTVQFEDCGVPFDPLKEDDPNVSLSVDERGIGGLGIYMVKQIMDEVMYEYRNNKNILIMKKHL